MTIELEGFFKSNDATHSSSQSRRCIDENTPSREDDKMTACMDWRPWKTHFTIGAAGDEQLILSSQTYPSVESFHDALKSHLTSRRVVTYLVLSVARRANNC